MIEAVQAAKKSAASRSTVLILGESGTGKEIFARAIHGWSDRVEKPFVAINCVGLSRDLLESELFGQRTRRIYRCGGIEERQNRAGSWRHGISR